MYTVHCTVYSVQCKLYSVYTCIQCTLYSVQCIVYNVHSTLYSDTRVYEYSDASIFCEFYLSTIYLHVEIQITFNKQIDR